MGKTRKYGGEKSRPKEIRTDRALDRRICRMPIDLSEEVNTDVDAEVENYQREESEE